MEPRSGRSGGDRGWFFCTTLCCGEVVVGRAGGMLLCMQAVECELHFNTFRHLV